MRNTGPTSLAFLPKKSPKTSTHMQCISVKALQIDRAVMNEWMFLSYILFAQQHTHTHTLNLILYFVIGTSPSPWLPFIFLSSLHHMLVIFVMVIGEMASLHHFVHFLSEGLPVTKPSLGLPDMTFQPFCALWCASHASFYKLCVSCTHSSKFKLTPGLCLCVCVHEFAMSFSVFECCICELCVYVQSVWLQALMRQRSFLFLWPLSKHIKSYLITAYTASAHIHQKIALTPNTQNSPPNSPNVSDPSRKKRRD